MLLESVPKLSSTDAQIVLRDRYETDFGIYNHGHPDAGHPFEMVLKHWSEDCVTGGALPERMKQFVDCDIGKFFNISFTEFIELPSFVIMDMIKVAEDKIARNQPTIDRALESLETSAKKR